MTGPDRVLWWLVQVTGADPLALMAAGVIVAGVVVAGVVAAGRRLGTAIKEETMRTSRFALACGRRRMCRR